ncbi:MAG TPA: sigma-70 family RNA polymerase sigma factor [Planctomycetaceae bacterium]
MRSDAAPAGRAVGEAEPPAVRPSVAPPPADAAWVEAAYDDHARELWAVFYSQCCDPDLAREALQEAFLRLHGQDRSTLRDVKAWLVRVGRNWLRDVARRRRHAAKPTEFLDDLPGERPTALDRLEADETQARVRACLVRMREDDREALVLRYALNWSSARMAEVLGVSAAAVDMRLSRARRRLADLLREDGFEIPEGI